MSSPEIQLADLPPGFELPPEMDDPNYDPGLHDFGDMLDGPEPARDEEPEEPTINAEYQRQYERVEAGILQSAPELLEGRLPADLERLVGHDYALGFNQAAGELIDTPEQADEYIQRDAGLSVGDNDLVHRFLITGHDFSDPNEREYTSTATVRGYYGPDRGKFVVVLPTAKPDLYPGLAIAKAMRGPESRELLPNDFYGDRRAKVIDLKYYAGFVDAEGRFYANPEFMDSKVSHHLGASALAEVGPDML